jgi:hypothetical protein
MKINNCSFVLSVGIVVLGIGMLGSCRSDNILNGYKGIPFGDAKYNAGAQTIPGKLQCEFYDFGGEGISFHDTDSINSGSGRLNPADGSYLHEFRINEPVDISFTKFQDPPIDNTQYNFVQPEIDQLYIGWTKPGEWTKYTVNIKKSGTYQLGLMYTSNKNGKISLSVNDIDITGEILVPTTFVEEDSVAWRQWHHWNYLSKMASIKLKKGMQIVTLRTADVGDMNYDYINFELVK